MDDGKAGMAARFLWFFMVAVAVMVMLPSDAFAIISPLGGIPLMPTIGGAMANVVFFSDGITSFIAAACYLASLLILVIGVVKIKDHVINPQQVPLSDGVKRLVVAGALASLPTVIAATVNTLTAGTGLPFLITSFFHTSPSCIILCTGPGSLDELMMNLMNDIWHPVQVLISAFSYLAGIILIIIGIFRLMKTAQEGPRGPSGSGTIMTFLVGGVLIALDDMLRYFSGTLFASNFGLISVYANMSFSTGDVVADGRILNVVSTCLAFMMVVGFISFVRGWFIIRDVAEGDSQASLMAGMTHVFGGALAVNLGPLLNYVQITFGLTAYGITFI